LSQLKERNSLGETQVKTMLNMQEKMNARVNPNWLHAGYPFLRAIIVEGAEALDHHGWKWWKTQEKDMDQLQMEIVDLWHFTLSAYLVWAKGDIDSAASSMLQGIRAADEFIDFDEKEYDIFSLDTIEKIELMIGLAASRRANVKLFGALLDDCEMDWSELYRQYVGKNTLNFFRQNNGYNSKPSDYRKEWAGREDNVHLVEIMGRLDIQASDFRDLLYQQLTIRYAETA
jgi:hypothetical protein